MNEEVVRTCKRYIEENNVCGLQVYYHDLLESDLDWPYIYQKVYLHACLRGSDYLADWLEKDLYSLMDPIQKVALRQIFPYGRHLLKRYKKMNPN